MAQDPFFQQAMQWPYALKLVFAVENSSKFRYSYERLLVHQAAAATQMDRLWAASALQQFTGPKPPSITAPQLEQAKFIDASRVGFQALLYETHFYFIAWHGCREMLQALTSASEFREARKVFNTYRQDFDHYARARHSFEHFGDRLPGGREEAKMKAVIQSSGAATKTFHGFHDGVYAHSNQEWDITPASLVKLNTAIAEVLAVVHAIVDTIIGDKFPSPIK